MRSLFRWSSGLSVPLSLVAGLVFTNSVHAFTFGDGQLHGSFDSTLSLAGLYRLNDPDPDYYGASNGGNQNSVNTDDGNLNYRKGIASLTAQGSHDLELQYGEHLGFFTRFFYLYDYENAHNERARTPLSDDAKEWVGRRIDYLDLYGLFRFETSGGIPVDVRLGRQVLSLGESTFLPNGNNVINPFDVAQLRAPGAELKEAFLPVNMLKVSADLTESLSVEAFWLLEFRKIELEPSGTYFSTSDFAARGGSKVMLGFGALSDQGSLGSVTRSPDRASDGGDEYGVALRYLAAGLNDTEFGFYYAHYHSRAPVISAITPTGPINTDLTGPLTAVFLQAGLPAANAAAQAAYVFNAIVVSKTNPGALDAMQLATLQSAQTQAAIAGAQQIALLTAAGSAHYFLDYVEGIDMLGVSFNADLASTGISWQGEVSYKHNVPVQKDDVELLFAALSTLNPMFGANNQVGDYLGQYGVEVPGFLREDVWTAQSTMTKVFGPNLGASQIVVVGEVGGIWLPDLPSKDILRFESPGTYTSGNQTTMTATGSTLTATPYSAFGDDFSWGYRILARLDYTNVFAGVNVSPSIAFSHDVSGNTPSPLANYLEDRKSIALSTEFVWKNAYAAELRYVNYYGGGTYNLLQDRDFVSATVKYSF